MALNLGELFGTIGLDASEFDKQLSGAQDNLKAFGVAGAAIAAAGAAAIGAAIGKGIAENLDIGAGNTKLKAQMDLTEEQSAKAGKAAGSLYANNYGDSMEQVQAATGSVMSSIAGMRDASQADLEDITSKALNLANTFDVDVAEAAATAGGLIKNGLATDAAQAMDLITGSMQKVPEAMRGEILPIMDEYSKHFGALGIDGETAMGMIVAASQDGAIGMDKMGDALKEFTIRGTDMSKSTNGVYESLGLNTKQMTNDLLAGGDTAEKAMGKIVHGLQGIEDPGAQAAAAVALFGTPLEDLGTDQIPNFLGMIDPMGDAFDSTAGAADKMADTLASSPKAGFESFKRQAETGLINVVNFAIMPAVTAFADFLQNEIGPAITTAADWITSDMMPALQAFGDWFTQNQDAIQVWAAIIGALMIPVFVRIAVAAGVSAAAQVVAWATASGGAIKAAAVYVAQSYVMIGRFIAMTAAAVAHGIAVAAVWTYQVIGSAVAGAAAMGLQAARVVAYWLGMSIGATVNAVKMAAGWVVGVLIPAAGGAIAMGVAAAAVVGGWILMGVQAMAQAVRMAAAWFIALGPIGWVIAAVIAIVALIIANWSKVSSFTAKIWGNIVAWITGAWANITAAIRSAGTKAAAFLTGIWTGIKSTAISIWTGIVNWVKGIPGKFLAGLVALARLHVQMGRWILSVKDAAVDKFMSLVAWVKGLPGRIVSALGSLGSLLSGAGRQILQGFLDGLKAGFESVKNFVGGIGSWIADHKGPKRYDLGLLVPAGGWIMDGLGSGIEKSLPGLASTLGDVSWMIANGIDPEVTGSGQYAFGANGASGAAASAPVTAVLSAEDRALLRAVADRDVAVSVDGREIARANIKGRKELRLPA